MLINYAQSPSTFQTYLRNQGQNELQTLKSQVQPDMGSLSDNMPSGSQIPVSGQSGQLRQNSILGKSTQLTQKFGNMNPGVEVMSNGFNSGADFAADPGTTVALPGNHSFRVLQAFAGDNTPGHIGDSTNSGYGNSVYAQDQTTGEKLRFSHLSQVNAKEGDVLPGGSILGATGETGNVTGPHLDLEYYNPQGQLQDVLNSPYAQYLPVQGQSQGPQGGGNPGFKYTPMHPDDINEVKTMYDRLLNSPQTITPSNYGKFESMVNGLSGAYLDKPSNIKSLTTTQKLDALFRRAQYDQNGGDK